VKNLVAEILRYAQNDNITCLIATLYERRIDPDDSLVGKLEVHIKLIFDSKKKIAL
jgi:hypothetical protein